jgi:hypothetical protein
MTEPNPKTLPRLENKMLLKDLKAEVTARGIVVKGKVTKQSLLDVLGLGSICISRTSEYRYVEKLRTLVENEKKLVEDEKQSQFFLEQEKRFAVARAEKEKRDKIIHDKVIKLNVCSQKLHTFVEKMVHSCPLALSKKLVAPQYKEEFVSEWNTNDNPVLVDDYFGSRFSNSCCDFCQTSRCLWSCEKCNFDVCHVCFEVEKLPPGQRKKRRAQLTAEEDDRIMRIKEKKAREWKQQQNEEAKRTKDEAHCQAKELEKRLGKFLPKHMDLPKVNRKSQGSGYTVWSANGGHWDGPPCKQFDSSWKSLDDAKQRAKYVFYIKNPWGLDALEVDNELDHVAKNVYGMDEPRKLPPGIVCLQMHDGENDEWTVSIVPDDAFKFLDNVDKEPNHHDDSCEDNDIMNFAF